MAGATSGTDCQTSLSGDSATIARIPQRYYAAETRRSFDLR